MASNKDTILYIDDDLLNLELFKEFFAEYYHVIILTSTKGAEEVLKNNKVKVIISDQCMPDETGIDFIKRINVEYPEIVKIIFTAYSSQEVALEAINDAAIFKFILKPWRKQEVKHIIESAVKQFDLEHEKNQLLLELQLKNIALEEANQKLVDNEKKFHVVFSNSNDSKYILNQQKRVIEVNPAFLDLIQYKKEDSLNFDDLNAYIKDRFPVLINKPVELSQNTKTSIYDFEISSASGEPKFIEINSNQISYNNSRYFLSIIRDISERRHFEKKIIDTIIQTQEEEQSRYARELHDGLGPLLSTLKMHLEWIANPDHSINKNKIIEHAIYTLDNAIRSTKEIANNLSPHILERFGIVDAVNSYIEHIKETSNIEFTLSSNLKERLAGNIEIVLYRTILECMNNSIKHSDAKKIIIKLNKESNNVKISYSDNGKGFDVEKEIAEGKGMGLFNIQSRIKHIGGTFQLTSKPNRGTDINININL
ncbi:MAG TPA: response regulator [Bacteroidales bacterium]|nr:response regulator [Bacteroidales bacterium]